MNVTSQHDVLVTTVEASRPQRWYWLSCKAFTVAVLVDEDNIILNGAPIVAKFVGQSASNLRRWMQGIGGFKWAAM